VVAQTGRETPRIPWDQIGLDPVLQLKFGINRQRFPLKQHPTPGRSSLIYENEYARLEGQWKEIAGFGSRLSFRLTNVASESIRVTRLVFPAENGIDTYASSFDVDNISFFRNGYQSWSTARSYLPKDKPLRPWLQLVSLASSNMANLPSNVPGVFSSEMYTIITNRADDTSFLVGQGAPFSQFFYIRLNLYDNPKRRSYFELTYDFGRKLIPPGQTIQLDAIYMAIGSTHALLHRYFREVSRKMGLKLPRENVRGWCSWYFYYNRITPDIIRKNVDALKRARDESGTRIDFVQIDDGYQKAVGDWLDLTEPFDGQMRFLSDEIRKAGFSPGIWIAPFVAARKSRLATIHPEYVLRDENGHRIVAGFNFFWPGRYYVGLDTTNPRFEEYLRRVIRTIVGEWGFPYLKCDFLFGGCLRGGTHHELEHSRAEVLRKGMRVIREEANDATREKVFLVGCGMPLSAGVGVVDAMRVGPDTGDYWINTKGRLLRTGAMVGVRNSIRNSLVRGAMHNALWINDPDCMMLRSDGTRLTDAQRRAQINAIVLTGGLLLYSDDFAALPPEITAELPRIQEISDRCFEGRLIPLDMMDRELPRIVLNTAGYLGVFNPSGGRTTVTVPLRRLFESAESVARVWKGPWHTPRVMREVWTGEEVPVERLSLDVPLGPYESRLYRLDTSAPIAE
jgi:alpha-galactosidase